MPSHRNCEASPGLPGVARRDGIAGFGSGVLRRKRLAVLGGAGLLLASLGLPARADTASGLENFQNGRFAEAFQQWTEAAAAGDARGALFVGVLYDTGLGVGQSYPQALEWYRRAAGAGNATGMFNVGVMYDAGRGAPPDPAQAAIWYERAAAKGVGRAEYNLALLYQAGTGVRASRSRAIQLFRRAADHGITAAGAHLQQLGVQQLGVQQPGLQQPGQRSAAVAVRAGDPAMADFQQAQQLLLARGPADAARAADLFRRAAERGNALAEYDYGYCYEHGLGVQRDPEQARAWYQRAASHATDGAVRSIALAGVRSLGGQSGPAPIQGEGLGR